MDGLKKAFDQINGNLWKKGNIPPLWDGNTAKRIVDILTELDSKK